MAVTSYSTLLSALSTFLGDTAQDSNRDDFIDFAEAYFNRKLRTYQMEEKTTLTTDADGLASLPTGLVAIRSVRYMSSPNRELRPISKGGENRLSPYDTAGDPIWYSITSISNTTKIRVTPIKSSASLVLTYWEAIPALDNSTTSNWLLALAPDAYFYRCIAEAYTWRQQFEKAAGFAVRADTALDEITSLDERARYSNAEIVWDTVAP